MRLLCFLFLVVVVLAITGFVIQNHQDLPLAFYDRTITAPVSAVLGIVYGLGMLTGWSIVRLLRRSFEAATDFRRREATQAR
jgi:hypothetical protein